MHLPRQYIVNQLLIYIKIVVVQNLIDFYKKSQNEFIERYICIKMLNVMEKDFNFISLPSYKILICEIENIQITKTFKFKSDFISPNSYSHFQKFSSYNVSFGFHFMSSINEFLSFFTFPKFSWIIHLQYKTNKLLLIEHFSHSWTQIYNLCYFYYFIHQCLKIQISKNFILQPLNVSNFFLMLTNKSLNSLILI